MQQQQQQNIWNEFNSREPPVVNFASQIETINAQQIKLRDQILQSEKNLTAQHQVKIDIKTIQLNRLSTDTEKHET